ncbi:MAG: polyprenyl diphosphate synthase [Deltaproteobacteria bacterium]|nr:polyprenyl diphosphate synthase [Deltaproteobacteria bacterium]
MNLHGLEKSRLPTHVAIIMDGNGRWARLRGKSRLEGHREGTAAVRATVELSRDLGIRYLSLYAFSSENWNRPHDEVEGLMALLESYLECEQERMMREGIRLMAIGDRQRLPVSVRRVLDQNIDLTRHNTAITVILALSYSGRDDIVRTVRDIARKVKEGEYDLPEIDESLVAAHTETGCIPDPDLLIRTSGEMRISNFFLWQIPYTELYITPTLWPDFSKRQYIEALLEFQRRQRRFGKTDEQILRG